jgi:tetratricopeptide (TPR) repeat protein
MRAWEYYNKADYETSMKRFNQAWLLDSFNADIYWGFGCLVGKKHQYLESLPLFQRSLELNSNNSKVYEGLGTSYGNLFFETEDSSLIDKSVENLRIAVQLDPKSAYSLSQLTAAYFYSGQLDSARKYLELADKLDPNVMKPDARKEIEAAGR